MNLNEYQEKAIRTANTGALTKERNLINSGFGVFDEAGEAAEVIKKASFQGHEIDKIKLKKELGDCLWYIALAAYCLDMKLTEINSLKGDHKSFEELDANCFADKTKLNLLNPNPNLTELENATMKFTAAAGKFNADILFLTPYVGVTLCTVFFYWAFFAKECGLSLDEIATENIKKLEARYPNGCFEAAKSINRKEGDI